MGSFHVLKVTLTIAMALVAAKLLLLRAGHEIPLAVSLPVLFLVLIAGLAASLLLTVRNRARGPGFDDLADAVEDAWVTVRKAVVLVLGLVILAASIPIGFLPGPGGIAVAIGGLALLATEFIWARQLLKFAKHRSQKAARRAQANINRNPRPWLIPILGVGGAATLWLVLHWLPWLHENVAWTRGVHARHVWLVALGPALAWLVWSYLNLAAWIRRRNGAVKLPPRTGAAASTDRSDAAA